MKTIITILATVLITANVSLQAQTWMQSGIDIDGEMIGDYSGSSISMSSDGNTLAIGAFLNNGSEPDAGHVRIYQWNGSSWSQKGSDIDGEAWYDWAGYSVSLSSDGNMVAIGAPGNDGISGDPYDDRGHVRIYHWNGSAWIQILPLP